MKEKTIIAAVIGLLVIGAVVVSRNTDALFVTGGVLFFILCIGYAEWCERL